MVVRRRACNSITLLAFRFASISVPFRPTIATSLATRGRFPGETCTIVQTTSLCFSWSACYTIITIIKRKPWPKGRNIGHENAEHDEHTKSERIHFSDCRQSSRNNGRLVALVTLKWSDAFSDTIDIFISSETKAYTSTRQLWSQFYKNCCTYILEQTILAMPLFSTSEIRLRSDKCFIRCSLQGQCWPRCRTYGVT